MQDYVGISIENNNKQLLTLKITIMKKQILIMMMSLFAISMMAEKKQEVVTFNVPMTCEDCVKNVESNMAFEKGVKDLQCNLENKTVKVTYLAEKTNVENLKKGFAKIGYDATVADEKCCENEQCKGECKGDKAKSDCCSKTKEGCNAKEDSTCKKATQCSDKKKECCKNKAQKEAAPCCGS